MRHLQTISFYVVFRKQNVKYLKTKISILFAGPPPATPKPPPEDNVTPPETKTTNSFDSFNYNGDEPWPPELK